MLGNVATQFEDELEFDPIACAIPNHAEAPWRGKAHGPGPHSGAGRGLMQTPRLWYHCVFGSPF